MNFNKTELLDNLGERVDNHLQITISTFQNQPERTLLRQGLSGGWSIAQCLDHLNSYGDYYLPRLNMKLHEDIRNNSTIYKSSWLGDYFTKIMEPSAKKYKAFKGHIPEAGLEAHGVIAKFIDQQEELLHLLRKGKASSLDRRIPISISPLVRLKAGDVLRFLIAHNERHMQQALRNLP